jgi:amino acid transporter
LRAAGLADSLFVSMSAPPTRSSATDTAGAFSLRHNYLSYVENVAQTLGTMAPTGTMGIILPLLIARAGNASWLSFLLILTAFSLILYCIYRFAEFSASAGALATYADAGLGRWAGAVTGWAYLAAMGFGVASIAPSSAYYADVVIARLTGVPGGVARGAGITAVVLVAAWAIAHHDIKLSTKVTIAIECTSLTVMIAIVGLAMVRNHAWIDAPQLHLIGANFIGIQSVLVFGFMTLAGFESVTALGEEASKPRRTIPSVIVWCMFPVGLLYLVMIYCLLALARKNGIALERVDAPFDSIARSMNLPSLGIISSVGIALSYFACALGSLNAGARVLYSMAQRKLFAARFGQAHPVNATPHRAIALISVLAFASPLAMLSRKVTLTDCINVVTQLTSFGYIGAYCMVCVALPFFLRRRNLLRGFDAAIATAATVILGAVLGLSVFPVPPPPWRYLPYLFLAFVAAGSAISWLYSQRRAS